MKKIFLLTFFTISLFAKNLLLLNSYSPTLEWTKDQTDTIIKTLEHNEKIKLFVEFMDTKVFKLNENNENNLLNYYTRKYKNIDFDIVITTDDNALTFTRKHKEKLFKDAKIFFSGVNNLSLHNTLDKNNFAGVFEDKDPILNLKIARTAVPNLKTVYLIGDDSPTARKEIIHYKEILKDIKDINFIYINHKDIEEVTLRLKNHEENSAMMLLVFTSFEKNGTHIHYKPALKFLTKTYQNPMLIHTNVFINAPDTNIIGGNCTDSKKMGQTVANYVLRHLNGTPLKNIGFSFKEGNKTYINSMNIEKFSLRKKDFKRFNPIYTNKEFDLYDEYFHSINFTITIIIFLMLFTFMLSRKNKAIKQLNTSLEAKMQQALSRLEEQHIKHEEESIKNTKFSTIGQMAAGITHEINTPLTYIKGTIEMTRYDLEDMPDNPYKEQLLDDNRKVMNGINRMALIVESMREVSQVTPPVREVSNIYASIITILRMTYNRSKHVSNIHVNGELFDLETSDKEKYTFNATVHKQRIEQVWTIILNNALDELVKIDDFDERSLNITIEPKNSKLEVTFCDNAGGVDEKIINNIFEPFISTKEHSGIGIGLNVAKKIIEEHEAKIEVENKDDGACFKIILNN